MSDPHSLRRHLRREFIRAYHPDRGGDPAAFVAGLAAFDQPAAPGRPAAGTDARLPDPVSVRVTVVRRLPWPHRLTHAVRSRVTAHGRPSRVR